ncbi:MULTISPECIES: helix-turn-helix transcriptional regulator [unclassified Nocardioides]|uniref:helix-turn-helix transcriptional regulator n=1 Tax=unclassified Nocardioides TaxID=2615069 RepID=UPI00360F7710
MPARAVAPNRSRASAARWPPIVPEAARRPPVPVFPLVAREAAVARLAAAAATSEVTLVCAPAGAGKTVLVSTWARATEDVTWLSLAHDDGRPGVFWWHLLDALSPRLPDWGPEAWPRGPEDPGAAVVDSLALGLEGLASATTTIVLDAFERLTDAGALEQLDRLLELVGNRLRLVVTTRARPDLPVHRYRLDGRLTEVGPEALGLSAAEVASLLAMHDLRPSEGAVRALTDGTEGWAAGVRLVALDLRDHGVVEPTERDVNACLEPAGTLVADYLRAEVLRALSVDDLDVLRQLSVVDGFGPALADALTGRADLASLTDLAHRAPFLRRDEHEFRLHPLARRMLYASLRDDRPGAAADLHRRAATWSAKAGDAVTVVDQLVRAGDHPQAVDLLLGSVAMADVLLPTPAGSRLAERLVGGQEGLDDLPTVVVDAAVALARGDHDDAAARLATISDDVPDDFALSAALVRARLAAARGEVDPALAAVAAGRHELDALPEGSPAAPTAYAVLQIAEATARLADGDLDAAGELFDDALGLLAADDLLEPRLECLARLALVEACRGRLSRALELTETVEQLASPRDLDLPTPPAALLARAWVANERQELSRARHWLGKASRADQVGADPMLASVAALLRARSTSDRGESTTTRRRRTTDGSGPEWLRAGRCRTRTGTSARVRSLLAAAQREWGRGRGAAGRPLVLEALRLAEPERLRRPFVHAGSAVHAVIRSDPQVAERATWLTPVDRVEPPPANGPGAEPVVDVALTERELEVLRHLEQMLSTQEIGSAMFISVNTVRTHVRHILHKLAVTRRNEAVRRARSLGLL